MYNEHCDDNMTQVDNTVFKCDILCIKLSNYHPSFDTVYLRLIVELLCETYNCKC